MRKRGQGEHLWSQNPPPQTPPHGGWREEFPLTDWILKGLPGNLKFPHPHNRISFYYVYFYAVLPMATWRWNSHFLPLTSCLKKTCWLYAHLTKSFESVHEAAVVGKNAFTCQSKLEKKKTHTSNSSRWSPKSLSPKSWVGLFTIKKHRTICYARLDLGLMCFGCLINRY